MASKLRSQQGLLPPAFASVVVLFVAATLYSQHGARAIHDAALDISGNAAPSIALLAGARSELRTLARMAQRDFDGDPEIAAASAEALAEQRRKLEGLIDRYLKLPPFPGEQTLLRSIAV